MALVVLKELHYIANGFYSVPQPFVLQSVGVEHGVAPVDFQDGLESRKVRLCLSEGTLDELYNSLLSLEINIGIVNPSHWA